MTQFETIVSAMLEMPDKVEWIASDFQKGKYFVGYEATARMSDLLRMHPGTIISGKLKRFRTISLNWKDKEGIDELRREYLDRS